ncbi:MAG: hypothetical protein ACRDD8_09520 [Bacteroidales bacterium]
MNNSNIERIVNVFRDSEMFYEVHEESIVNFLRNKCYSLVVDGGNETFNIIVLSSEITNVSLNESYTLSVYFTFEHKQYCMMFTCYEHDTVFEKCFEISNFRALSYDVDEHVITIK